MCEGVGSHLDLAHDPRIGRMSGSITSPLGLDVIAQIFSLRYSVRAFYLPFKRHFRIADKEIISERRKMTAKWQNEGLGGIRSMSNRTDIAQNSKNGVLNQISNRCDLGSCRFCLSSGECAVPDQRRECLRVMLLILSDPEDARRIMDHLKEVREELGS